jgi:hypothetical protein
VSVNSRDLQAIKSQLQALTNCILDKAEADPDFAKQLETILGININAIDSPLPESNTSTLTTVRPSLLVTSCKELSDDTGPTIARLGSVKPNASSTPAKTKSSKTPKSKKKLTLNPVAYLHEYGEAALREKLDLEATSDLEQILRSEGICKGKIKIADRAKAIDDISQYAIRQLNKGSAFL